MQAVWEGERLVITTVDDNERQLLDTLIRGLVKTDHSYTGFAEAGAAYVGPEEVARTLGLSTKTVYKQLNDGTLPAKRIGNKWRINTSQLR